MYRQLGFRNSKFASLSFNEKVAMEIHLAGSGLTAPGGSGGPLWWSRRFKLGLNPLDSLLVWFISLKWNQDLITIFHCQKKFEFERLSNISSATTFFFASALFLVVLYLFFFINWGRISRILRIENILSPSNPFRKKIDRTQSCFPKRTFPSVGGLTKSTWLTRSKAIVCLDCLSGCQGFCQYLCFRWTVSRNKLWSNFMFCVHPERKGKKALRLNVELTNSRRDQKVKESRIGRLMRDARVGN